MRHWKEREQTISSEFVPDDDNNEVECPNVLVKGPSCALAEIHLRTPVTAAGRLPPHHYIYHPVRRCRCNYYIWRAEPLGQICAQTGSTGQIKNYSDRHLRNVFVEVPFIFKAADTDTTVHYNRHYLSAIYYCCLQLSLTYRLIMRVQLMCCKFSSWYSKMYTIVGGCCSQ